MNNSEGMAVLAGLGIFFAIFLGFMLLITVVMLVIYFIALWKLFVKAGEDGWKAIIPIYNTLVMSKIATGNFKLGAASLIVSAVYLFFMSIGNTLNMIATSGNDSSLAVLSIISLPMSLLAIVCAIGMAVIGGYFHYVFTESYGKETVWCVLSIFFFPIIMLILAFDKNTHYAGPKNHIKWLE